MHKKSPFVGALIALSLAGAQFHAVAQFNQSPSPGNRNAAPFPSQPNILSGTNQDAATTDRMAAARQDRLARERLDHLKAGAIHLNSLCAQLQGNLAQHPVPDESDRKLMADIEKQIKTLRTWMVQ